MQSDINLGQCITCGAPLSPQNITGHILTCEYCKRQYILQGDFLGKLQNEYYWLPVIEAEQALTYGIWKTHGKEYLGKKRKNLNSLNVELKYIPLVEVRNNESFEMKCLFNGHQDLKDFVATQSYLTEQLNIKSRKTYDDVRKTTQTANILPIDGLIYDEISAQYGDDMSPVVKYLPIYVWHSEGGRTIINATTPIPNEMLTYEKEQSESKKIDFSAKIIYKIIYYLLNIILLGAIAVGAIILFYNTPSDTFDIIVRSVILLIGSFIAYILVSIL
jgi:hypothetical protein